MTIENVYRNDIVDEFEHNIDNQIIAMLAISHLSPNAFKILDWLEKQMRGLFTASGLGHTSLNLKNKSCTFQFNSSTDKSGKLLLVAHPKLGIIDMVVEIDDEHIEFLRLYDVLDYWEGKIELEDLESEYYRYYKFTEEDKDIKARDEREAYEYDQYKSLKEIYEPAA